eukprot:gene40076-48837_t
MDQNRVTQRKITLLRKFQADCEEKIRSSMEALESEAQLKNLTQKEAEELCRHSGKLCLRWRRLTSLTVETLVELDREVADLDMHAAVQAVELERHTQELQALEHEVQQMENLANVMYGMVYGQGY